MSLSKFVPVLLTSKVFPVRVSSDHGERSIGELLKERLGSLQNNGDIRIMSVDGYQLSLMDSYVWNLWLDHSSSPAEEDPDIVYSSQVEVYMQSMIEIGLSKNAALSLVSFMFTGEFLPNYKTTLEIFKKGDDIGIHPQIMMAAKEVVLEDITLRNLINAWSNQSTEVLTSDKTFLDLSVSFILSRPTEIFVPSASTVVNIPRELLECFLPDNLKQNMKVYKKLGEGRWNPQLRESANGMIYIKMKHSQLAHFLFTWALLEYNKRSQPNSIPNLLQMEEIIGNLFLLLDPNAFNPALPENMDITAHTAIQQAIGVFYFHMLVSARNLSIDSKKRCGVIDCKMVFTPNQRDIPMDSSENWQMSETAIEGPSSPSVLSCLPLTMEKKRRMDPLVQNPVLQLLKNEGIKKRITNVSFFFGPERKCVKTHTYVLSLQSEEFADYFRRNPNTHYEFELGEAVNSVMVESFVNLFYIDALPVGKTLVDCVCLVSHLKLTSIMKRAYFAIQRMPITNENVSLKYHFEERIGSQSRLAPLLGNITQNLGEIIKQCRLGMFETLDFIEAILKIPRDQSSEFAVIKCLLRWGKYNGSTSENLRRLIQTRYNALIKFKHLSTGQLNDLVSTHKVLTYLEGLKFAREGGSSNSNKS